MNLFMTDFAADGAKVYCYSQDGLGSVRTLTDKAGDVVNKYDYTAFGQPYSLNVVETVANRYQFTRSQRSSVSGNNSMRYRTQDPSTGRFLTRDPIGYKDGPNQYAYVGNSPLRWVDPFGLEKACCGDKEYETTTPLL